MYLVLWAKWITFNVGAIMEAKQKTDTTPEIRLLSWNKPPTVAELGRALVRVNKLGLRYHENGGKRVAHSMPKR